MSWRKIYGCMGRHKAKQMNVNDIFWVATDCNMLRCRSINMFGTTGESALIKLHLK